MHGLSAQPVLPFHTTYDAAGKLIAEYSTIVATTSTAQVSYLTNDHLGSPRITTDKDGDVYSRRDFMPFGDEITAVETSQRSVYGADLVRQEFTSYERDIETDLDYAKARLHSFNLGRFNSADPYNIVLEVKNVQNRAEARKLFVGYLSKTQQWNRYSYVANNPLLYIDPSGETLVLTGTYDEKLATLTGIREMIGKRAFANLSVTNTKDGWKISYEGPGGLALGGEIGAIIEGLVDSDKNVYLRTSNSRVVKEDVTARVIDLATEGGGKTTATEGNKNIGILVAKDAATIGTDAFKSGDMRGDNGELLTSTFTIALAHEIGHAYAFIAHDLGERYDKGSITSTEVKDSSTSYSLIVENMERKRLGLPNRLTN